MDSGIWRETVCIPRGGEPGNVGSVSGGAVEGGAGGAQINVVAIAIQDALVGVDKVTTRRCCKCGTNGWGPVSMTSRSTVLPGIFKIAKQ
jgi:hypothetical protein